MVVGVLKNLKIYQSNGKERFTRFSISIARKSNENYITFVFIRLLQSTDLFDKVIIIL